LIATLALLGILGADAAQAGRKPGVSSGVGVRHGK
jgi:hypothetical protein